MKVRKEQSRLACRAGIPPVQVSGSQACDRPARLTHVRSLVVTAESTGAAASASSISGPHVQFILECIISKPLR